MHLSKLAIDEIFGLLKNESHYRDTIDKLETDLRAFKAAYTSSEKGKQELEEQFEKLRCESEKKTSELENQLKVE